MKHPVELTPRCPGCDSEPMEFGGLAAMMPDQKFCSNDHCHVMMWDPTKSVEELADGADWINPPDL